MRLDAAVVATAVEACAALIACPLLVAAWEQRGELPVRLLVVGRQGVGKTSLINALTGHDRPTGLGGVTRDVAPVATARLSFFDTPGIESESEAIHRVQGLLPRVDAVVIVVDGLMPVTEIERAVLLAAVPPSVGLHAVIGRWDLVEDTDREAVLARVRRELACRSPLSVVPIDARQPDQALAVELAQLRWERSPRRCERLRQGLREARMALEHLPLPEDPVVRAGRAAETWREAVRTAHAVLVSELPTVRAPVERLHRDLVDACRALAHTLQSEASWTLSWRPAPPPLSRLDVRRVLSPTASAQRELLAYAAAQAGEGALACRELTEGAAARRDAARREAIRGAFAASARALQALSLRTTARSCDGASAAIGSLDEPTEVPC